MQQGLAHTDWQSLPKTLLKFGRVQTEAKENQKEVEHESKQDKADMVKAIRDFIKNNAN